MNDEFYLKDSSKNFVKLLTENEKTTVVSSSSTDYEIPTAKAVYDVVQGGGSSSPVKSVTSGNGLELNQNGDLSLSTATTSSAGAMTSSDKTKLNSIEDGAEVNTVDSVSTGNGLNLSSRTLSMSTATTSSAGAMSSSDKTKLNGIDTGAQVNYIKSIGTANGLSVNSSGALSLAAATTSSAGAMSSSDKTKLNGIDTGAQVNYIKSIGTANGLSVNSSGALSLSTATTSSAGAMSSSDKTKLNGLSTPVVTSVTTGNGLSLSSGTLKMNVGTTSTPGALSVTTGNGLKLSSGTLSMSGLSNTLYSMGYTTTSTVTASQTSTTWMYRAYQSSGISATTYPYHWPWAQISSNDYVIGTYILYTSSSNHAAATTTIGNGVSLSIMYGKAGSLSTNNMSELEIEYNESLQNTNTYFTNDSSYIDEMQLHDIYIPNKTDLEFGINENLSISDLGWSFYLNTGIETNDFFDYKDVHNVVHEYIKVNPSELTITGWDLSTVGVHKIVVSHPSLFGSETFYIKVRP